MELQKFGPYLWLPLVVGVLILSVLVVRWLVWWWWGIAEFHVRLDRIAAALEKLAPPK